MPDDEGRNSFRERLQKAFIRRTLPETYNPNTDQTVLALMALTLDEAMEKHSGALVKATEASDKYSRRLAWATWALVAATAALVLVELLPLLGWGMGGR